jgi:hypothetical protein
MALDSYNPGPGDRGDRVWHVVAWRPGRDPYGPARSLVSGTARTYAQACALADVVAVRLRARLGRSHAVIVEVFRAS